jgi:hypothetical protein
VLQEAQGQQGRQAPVQRGQLVQPDHPAPPPLSPATTWSFRLEPGRLLQALPRRLLHPSRLPW